MIRQIGAAARRPASSGVSFAREGSTSCGSADRSACGVPRHREIGAKTARRIMADLEPILGTRWWQV